MCSATRAAHSTTGEVFGNTREDERMRVLGRSVTYCSKLTTEEAREVAEPLSRFDPDPHQWGRLAYLLAEAVNNLRPTTIWFEPYFPDGQVTCSACG
jgi:hypothetical protein